jgi:hypothetical protein
VSWHLDEVYLKIDGRMVYLWRAVDAEGEVLDVLVQAKKEQACRAETHAQAFEEIWLPAGDSGHGRFAILPRRRARTRDRASALHRPRAKQ